MYQPPPGRPISTPPDDTPAAEPQKRTRGPNLTAEQIMALRADYLAGMSMKEIEAKHGVKGGGYKKNFRDLPRRLNRKDNARPTQLPGESNTAYAGRIMGWKMQNDPEFRAKVVAKRNRTLQRKRLRAARAEQKRIAKEMQNTMAPFEPAQTRKDNWQVVVAPPSLWQRIVGWFR